MSLTLYGHRLSQPCRAVEILLRELGLDYTWQQVDFANGATHEHWFVDNINAFETIPALVATDDKPGATPTDLRLGESHAMMRYLCRIAMDCDTAHRWYPGDQDPARSARIDQWLDWHHNHVRRHDMFHHIMNLHLTLPMLKREIDTDLLRPRQASLRTSLGTLEQQLRSTTADSPLSTLCGDTEPTIADLAIASELYQIAAVGYHFNSFPAVENWLDALVGRPHFQAVSEAITEQGRTINENDAVYLRLDHAFA
ncbi:glutathione S-transferase family protein [Salinisphaera sp. USBA-960]|uniref:glutathione S-transferase family protein n=1 Tax=Salinisphaera orenii TaxID=856731 RepID=UPI000DBE9496|nr:glutathione S-transferase family protein [Salifodinibacter halophilus]NNC25596.1 glutathione S-transferase family protein [Salifodinibacter halophilus]